MQKSNIPALAGILAVFMMLTACPIKDEYKKPDNLQDYYGKWATVFSQPPYDDWFEITADKIFVYYNCGDPTNDIAYKGIIADTDVSGDYTFISIKLSDPSRSPWGLAVGSYTRVALKKSSTATECDMSTATLGTFPDTDQTADTLAAVKEKFTLETDAFGYWGTYKKK